MFIRNGNFLIPFNYSILLSLILARSLFSSTSLLRNHFKTAKFPLTHTINFIPVSFIPILPKILQTLRQIIMNLINHKLLSNININKIKAQILPHTNPNTFLFFSLSFHQILRSQILTTQHIRTRNHQFRF